jgi:hypothetical protein
MNLFEKIAKEKDKKTKSNVLTGITAGIGGIVGANLTSAVPVLTGRKLLFDKPVLQDVKKQEIMDYYNKTYGTSLTDADEYAKQNPKAKKLFQNIYFKASMNGGKLNVDKVKKHLSKSGIPTDKKWVIGVEAPMDAAFSSNKHIGLHFYDKNLTKNKALAAHELAHLSDNWLEHPQSHTVYGAGNSAVGLGLIYSGVQGARGKDLSNTELALASLGSLPVLAAESKANWRAAKAIHALKGTKGLKEALPSLLLSQGSYTALPFLPYLANKYSKKIKDSLDKRNNK